MFKRKQRGTCSIHGDYDGEVCGFCAMGNRLKSLDRNALIQRIEELEAQACPNCDLIEKEVERLRESEKFFADRCGDAELKLLELQRKYEALGGSDE